MVQKLPTVVIVLIGLLCMFVGVSAFFFALISWFMSDWIRLTIELILIVGCFIAYWKLSKIFIARISLSASLRQKPTILG